MYPTPVMATDGPDPTCSRRQFLATTGGVALPSALLSGARARPMADRDDDGLPDGVETSADAHERLRERFGDAFEGFDPDRPDLLVDVRLVGDAAIDPAVVEHLTRRFDEHGINLQWLTYPDRYDEAAFVDDYANNVRRILWSPGSFYFDKVEEFLQPLAFQLIVVPGKRDDPYAGRVYSPYARYVMGHPYDGWINGMCVGNRAVIGDREAPREQARLALHEIGHLALNHDDDPDNHGVMGTHRRIDLTDAEWTQLREGLSAVRDSTGYDFLFDRRLWKDQLPSLW